MVFQERNGVFYIVRAKSGPWNNETEWEYLGSCGFPQGYISIERARQAVRKATFQRVVGQWREFEILEINSDQPTQSHVVGRVVREGKRWVLVDGMLP